jgi:cytidylate kinase
VQAAQEIEKDDFFDIRLREERVGVAASVVSAKPEVRAVLLDFQRQFAQSDNGAVLDGRDIGTVVCPDACVKIFLTADVEARANRRYHQLLSLGMESDYEQVLADLNARDKRDAERAAAPLKAAEDAVSLDSTKLDADAVFQAVVNVLHQKMRA